MRSRRSRRVEIKRYLLRTILVVFSTILSFQSYDICSNDGVEFDDSNHGFLENVSNTSGPVDVSED